MISDFVSKDGLCFIQVGSTKYWGKKVGNEEIFEGKNEKFIISKDKSRVILNNQEISFPELDLFKKKPNSLHAVMVIKKIRA